MIPISLGSLSPSQVRFWLALTGPESPPFFPPTTKQYVIAISGVSGLGHLRGLGGVGGTDRGLAGPGVKASARPAFHLTARFCRRSCPQPGAAGAVGRLTGQDFASRLDRAVEASNRAKLIEGRVIEREGDE